MRIIRSFISVALIAAIQPITGIYAAQDTTLLLFPGVKATITRNGEPVVGAKIERSAFWNVERGPRLDYAYTNEMGEFEFSAVWGSAGSEAVALLLNQSAQPTVNQRIYQVDPEFGSVLLYAAVRVTHEQTPETGDEVIEFDCDASGVDSSEAMFQLAECRLRLLND